VQVHFTEALAHHILFEVAPNVPDPLLLPIPENLQRPKHAPFLQVQKFLLAESDEMSFFALLFPVFDISLEHYKRHFEHPLTILLLSFIREGSVPILELRPQFGSLLLHALR